MNLLGLIEIERKTDVLAFTAFIVSVLTATYQIGLFLVGPDPKLLVPEGVTIARFDNRPDQSFISIIAPISIANTSGAQEPLLVTKQTAEISFAGVSIPLQWHDTVEAPIAGDAVKFSESRVVYPFVVDRKGIVSKVVRFTPQRQPCREQEKECDPNRPFVSFDQFRSMFLEAMRNGVKSARVTFTVESANHAPVRVVCDIPLVPNHLKLLRNVGYFSELC